MICEILEWTNTLLLPNAENQHNSEPPQRAWQDNIHALTIMKYVIVSAVSGQTLPKLTIDKLRSFQMKN